MENVFFCPAVVVGSIRAYFFCFCISFYNCEADVTFVWPLNCLLDQLLCVILFNLGGRFKADRLFCVNCLQNPEEPGLFL